MYPGLFFNFIFRSENNCFSTVPPKLAHFDFGEEPSNFGDSASVQCLVTSGDLPIEFRWLFNGRPVSEISGITTAKMGKRNSVLTIDSVTDRHVGLFTCKATNIATTANFTAELIVNGINITKTTLAYSQIICFCYSCLSSTPNPISILVVLVSLPSLSQISPAHLNTL